MNKVLHFIEKYSHAIFYMAVIFVFAVLSSIVTIKYYNFHYNALDLGIFTDTLYHTVTGQWFYSSIQQTNYIGDHFSPALLLWLPDFLLFRSPLILIVEQVFLLVFSAVIFFWLARKRLSASLALLLSLVYLFNPYLWNQAVYEFSPLCLLPLGLMLMFWSLENKRFYCFLAFLFFCLMLREDVALLVGMLGWFLLIKDNRQKYGAKFGVVTVVISGIYFLLSMFIISLFNDGGNKFFGYYQNLWFNLFNLGQIDLVLGAFLPVGFLILFRPRWLLPLLVVYLEFVFLGGQGSMVWQFHYSVFFYPIIYFGLIDVFHVQKYDRKLIFSCVIFLSASYAFFSLGPILAVNTLGRQPAERQAIIEILATIPDGSKVLVSSEFIAPLAARNEVYSMHYAFLGVKQFVRGEYGLPADLDYILIDQREWLDYSLIYPYHPIYHYLYDAGSENITQLLAPFSLVQNYQDYYLFQYQNDRSQCAGDSLTIEKEQFYQLEKFNDPMPGWWLNELYQCRINSDKEIKITPLVPVARSVNLNKMNFSNRDYLPTEIGESLFIVPETRK